MTYHVAQGAFTFDANLALPPAPAAPSASTNPASTINWGTVTYGDASAKPVPVASAATPAVTTLYTPKAKTSATTLYSPSVKTAVKTLYSSSPAQVSVMVPEIPVTAQEGGNSKALIVGGLLVLVLVGGVAVWRGTKK